MMTIEQADKVDGIGIDKHAKEVVLLISDHLLWDEEHAHIAALENKLVEYLSYIGSGQYLELIPQAKHYPVRIKLVHEHKPTGSARTILGTIESQLRTLNILFSCESLPSDY